MEGAVAGADFPSKVVTFSNAEVAIWQNSWPEGGVSYQILPIDIVKGAYGQPLPCYLIITNTFPLVYHIHILLPLEDSCLIDIHLQGCLHRLLNIIKQHWNWLL